MINEKNNNKPSSRAENVDKQQFITNKKKLSIRSGDLLSFYKYLCVRGNQPKPMTKIVLQMI